MKKKYDAIFTFRFFAVYQPFLFLFNFYEMYFPFEGNMFELRIFAAVLICHSAQFWIYFFLLFLLIFVLCGQAHKKNELPIFLLTESQFTYHLFFIQFLESVLSL